MPKTPRNTKTSKARSSGHLTWIQKAQLSAVRRVSIAVAGVAPPLPSLPFADRLPGAKRVVNWNFDRARRLLENQRAFALGLVEAVEPVTDRDGGAGRDVSTCSRRDTR
jgi:hypothetical protein